MNFRKNFSLEPNVSQSSQPTEAGCVEHAAVAQICEALDKYRDQSADPIMGANVYKIIENCLFPEICYCILADKIDNQHNRWNKPARKQRQKIHERPFPIKEPDHKQNKSIGYPYSNGRFFEVEGYPAQNADPERSAERKILLPGADKQPNA